MNNITDLHGIPDAIKLLGALLTVVFFGLIVAATFAILEIKRTLHRMENRQSQVPADVQAAIKVAKSPKDDLYGKLASYRDDYREAGFDDRRIIAQTVSQEFASVNVNQLPAEWRHFLTQLQVGQ
jgi:hypothetical protein